MAVTQSQFVTVPVLDARFADLRAELRIAIAELDKKIEVTQSRLEKKIEVSKADLVRWVFLVMLGNVALTAGTTALVNMLQHPHQGVVGADSVTSEGPESGTRLRTESARRSQSAPRPATSTVAA